MNHNPLIHSFTYSLFHLFTLSLPLSTVHCIHCIHCYP
jgi:hypothetical protein